MSQSLFPDSAPASLPDVEAPAWVDLSQYNQSGFDRGRPGWIILLWWLVQAIVFPLSPHPYNGLRVGLLRLFGAKIGKDVIIRPTARFTYPWKIEIGDSCWIGDDVVFYSLDRIQLGQHCVISQRSYLCTGSHDAHDPTFALKTAPIVIGNGVWVAANCFVSLGVQIGSNTIVGACSSVLNHLPAQAVCWGNPCLPRHPRTIA
jgi:putative colanic acid biosynthesis acetyltransferase WcaF